MGLHAPSRRPSAPFCLLLLALQLGCTASDIVDPDAIDEVTQALALADLVALAGDAQEAEVGSMLAEPLTVRVTSSEGTPLAGVSIEWTFQAGGGLTVGSTSPATSSFVTTTDAFGQGSALWVLGTRAGQQQASAQILVPDASTPPAASSPSTAPEDEEQTVVFTASAQPASVEEIVLHPTAAVMQPGDTLTVEAQPRDEYGNIVESAPLQWGSSNTAVASVNGQGFVEVTAPGSATISAQSGNAQGIFSLLSQADPAVVTDLSVASVTETSVTISWTEVSDGAGGPADYMIRHGSPTISWGSAAATEQLINGTSVGATPTFTWTGLLPATNHQFQLVAYRGPLAGEHVFGDLSNIVSATTESAPPPPPPQVASVTVTPASASINVNGTVQLNAVVRDTQGNTMSAPLTWTPLEPNVASVNTSGLVTGHANGSARIVATSSSFSDTASVSVSAAPQPPAIQTTTLAGAQVGSAYAASLQASGGAPPYTWRVLSGSLPNGLGITASGGISGTPTAPGTVPFTVVVNDQNQLADTAQLSISVSVSTPPPPVATIYFEEGFEGGGFAGRGWYDNTSLSLTTQEKVSGNSALEVRFNQGATTPTFGGSARHIFDETESVYVSYWVKYSDNWVGSGASYHPHDIQLATNEDGLYIGPRDSHLTTYIETNYQSGIRPVLGMRDRLNINTASIDTDLTHVTENRAAAGCNGNTDGYRTGCFQMGSDWVNEKFWKDTQHSISPGVWHFVEVFFQLNSIQNGIGITDGVARYSLDGNIVLDMTDVLFRTGAHPNMKFRQFLLAPYIGDGSPLTQTMWIDDLTVASHP